MTLIERLHVAFAVLGSLYGAAGVALLAAGAHGADTARLSTAGGFLLAHAPVLLVLAAWPPPQARNWMSSVSGLAMLVGPALFAGDLVMRVFTGASLFPMAAPTGGVLTMAAWLCLALTALVTARPR